MFNEYIVHNQFWNDLKLFYKSDPHLSQLKNIKYVHPLDWWMEINWKEPGIYILTGGRQIGKSTSTKLLIKYLLENRMFQPRNIFYFPCDQIDDYHFLTRLINTFFNEQTGKDFLLILDEITFVRDWDRGIKSLADEGHFRKGFCILTGSDTVLLKEAAVRFPGRRGNADKTDFHIFPLTFKEYVKLTNPDLLTEPEGKIVKLYDSFNKFLNCGGYLRAINELHSVKKIKDATFITFEQWIIGDFLKRGKNINNLKYILSILYRTTTTQITFSNLARDIGSVSKDTFIDYCVLMENMGIINILEAFDQNKMRGFPKKARKVHFTDPFISNVIGRLLMHERYISELLDESIRVESIVASDLMQKNSVYYIKAEGEVDIIFIKERKFQPIEVKWSGQIRPNELKQIRKYKNSLILTRKKEIGVIEGIKTIPVPLFILQ